MGRSVSISLLRNGKASDIECAVSTGAFYGVRSEMGISINAVSLIGVMSRGY